MVRPLRMQVAGGWYHLTARGNERRAIYRGTEDYDRFLELVGELEERFGLRIASYVLMPNHYHLLAELVRPELSRAMQWLNLTYGAWFNMRHHRVGHLFQGRFHSALIDDDGSWLLRASEYIHLNPVRVAALGLDKRARAVESLGWLPAPDPEQVAERLRVLRTYRWSSYRALAGLASRPRWLAAEALLRRAGGREAYCLAVEERVRQGQPEPFRSHLLHGIGYGSEGFGDRVRALASGRKLAGREHGGRRKLVPAVGLADVVRAVEAVKGEKMTAFAERHGDTGRDLVWWAARRFAGLPLAELAGDAVDYSTVSAAVGRLERRAGKDRDLARAMRQIAEQLSNPKI